MDRKGSADLWLGTMQSERGEGWQGLTGLACLAGKGWLAECGRQAFPARPNNFYGRIITKAKQRSSV